MTSVPSPIQERHITAPIEPIIKASQSSMPLSGPGDWRPTRGFYSVFIALLFLVLMVSLDSTSITVALPVRACLTSQRPIKVLTKEPHFRTIAKDLQGSTLETFWTGTAFLLTSAVFMLPSVSLSHIFGRRSVIMSCTILFLVGIIVASVARDFTVVIVGRTIQGIGGGGIVLLLDVIITDLVPMRQRGAYMGIVGAFYAIATVSGPVIGGVPADGAMWRWLFWINIPFAVVSLVLVPIFLRLKRTPGSIAANLKRFDWAGTILCVGSLTTFLIPVSWGGVQFPWDSAGTLVPLIVGAAAIAGFAVYEWFVPAEALIRLHLFSTYNMWYSIIAAMLHNLVTYGILYFIPLYFEAVKQYSPLIAGVGFIPVTLTVAPMSIGVGVFISKTGSFRPAVWLGWSVTTLGTGLLILLNAETTVPQWVFLSICVGVGLGLLFTSLNIVNIADADDKSMAHAVGLFMFFRALGQSVGIAICGSIFQNRLRSVLSGSEIPSLVANADMYSQDAQLLIRTIADMMDGAEKSALIVAYAEALKPVWAALCAVAGLGLVGSLFLKHRDLNREFDPDQGISGATMSHDQKT